MRFFKKMKKESIFAILLVVLSVSFTLLAAELVYRYRLYPFLKRFVDKPTYFIANQHFHRYHQQFGYTYVPAAKGVVARVMFGKVGNCRSAEINDNGNIGLEQGSWDKNHYKILIFGDSMTANPPDSMTWTDYLADYLESKGKKKIAIKNFARDGYGILQMFDLARVKLAEYKPDLVIFAFITDDLIRARSWRQVYDDGTFERLIVSPKAGQPPDMTESIDLHLFSRKLKQQWCKKMLSLSAAEQTTDPLLQEFNNQAKVLLKKNMPNIFSLKTSFLYSRIVYKNPYYTSMRPTHLPLTFMTDFLSDQKFTKAAKVVRQSALPIALLRLPICEDIKEAKYFANEQILSLIASLEKSLGTRVIDLFDYLPDKKIVPESLYYLPYDYHPNANGSKYYAQAIAKALLAKSLGPGVDHLVGATVGK